MKVYTRLVLDADGKVLEEDSFEHTGPVAEAKGGDGGGNSTTTTVQELSPEQRKLLAPAIPVVRDFVQNPPKDFQGSRVAPFNETQLQAQGMLKDAATGSAADFTNYLLSNQQRLNEIGLNPQDNPALPGLLEAGIRPLTENLTQQVLPNIGQEAVAGGQYGGSRQGIAEGMASQAYFNSAQDVVSRVLGEAYSSGLDNATKAQALGPTVLGTQSVPAQLLSAVGEQQYGQEQAQLTDEIQRYFNEQLLPFLAAKEAAGVAFGVPSGSTITDAALPANSTSTLQGLLGGASAGAGIGSAFNTPYGTGIGAGLGGLAGIFFS